jgi:hypothetical protein
MDDNNNAYMSVNQIIGSFISKTTRMTPVSYYLMFFVIYIISFYCIFQKNTEFIGYGLLYVVNIFATIFSIKDIYIKLGDKDMFFIIFIVILILNIVSSSLFILSIARIYSYSKNRKKILLSHENRRKIHLYRHLFTSVIVCMIILIFYVLISNVKPIFNITTIISDKSSLLEKIIESIKILLVIYSLGTSAYLVYNGNDLVKITRSLI